MLKHPYLGHTVYIFLIFNFNQKFIIGDFKIPLYVPEFEEKRVINKEKHKF